MKIKRMFAAAKNSTELLLYVYDQIGADWFNEGVTAKGVAEELRKAGKIDSITMRINSPGGDVFEGLAIFNLLKAQGVPVNVFIDGLAASAASVLAMVGDSITIADNAMMMIHNAWTIALGDANEMRKTADLLDKISGVIVDTYSKRSGVAPDDVKAMMDAETWLTGEEAVSKGFADKLTETEKKDAAEAQAVAASFDLSKFAKTPAKFKVATDTGPSLEECKVKFQDVNAPFVSAADTKCACDCATCQGCQKGSMAAALETAVTAEALRETRARHAETILKQ